MTEPSGDSVVIALRIEPELLPEWFETVKDIAGRLCRRMAVIEDPAAWRVQVELPREHVDPFRSQLSEAWQGFVAERKAQGRWSE